MGMLKIDWSVIDCGQIFERQSLAGVWFLMIYECIRMRSDDGDYDHDGDRLKLESLWRAILELHSI